MILGNRLLFAVEFELNQEYEGTWLFGKFCYWIRGKRIGDYELGTSLRDVLFSLETLVKDNGNRTHVELYGLSKIELFERLDGVLFGYEKSPYDEIAVQEAWARFNVVLPVDIFDGNKIYLVENFETSRMIIKDMKEVETQEEHFQKGLFDEVIFRAYQEIVKLYNNEVEHN